MSLGKERSSPDGGTCTPVENAMRPSDLVRAPGTSEASTDPTTVGSATAPTTSETMPSTARDRRNTAPPPVPVTSNEVAERDRTLPLEDCGLQRHEIGLAGEDAGQRAVHLREH